jgi:hypothetical protein
MALTLDDGQTTIGMKLNPSPSLIRNGKTRMQRFAVKSATCAIVLLLNSLAYAKPIHHCTSEASEQAEKLLAFHFGPDNRIEIAKAVKQLAPIRNPANKKQLLDVLEIWGTIYKGQYRMRFIYARLPGECVLMGQEVLEYASL